MMFMWWVIMVLVSMFWTKYIVCWIIQLMIYSYFTRNISFKTKIQLLLSAKILKFFTNGITNNDMARFLRIKLITIFLTRKLVIETIKYSKICEILICEFLVIKVKFNRTFDPIQIKFSILSHKSWNFKSCVSKLINFNFLLFGILRQQFLYFSLCCQNTRLYFR